MQLDGTSPGVVGCSTPAQGNTPAKTAASILRVASRDILAPYSPIASKSVRCRAAALLAFEITGGPLLAMCQSCRTLSAR